MTGGAEINFEPLCAQNEKEWDALVELSPNGHLMARTGFFRYHSDRFEDASLFIRRGRKPLGVLPANRAGDVFWSHQGVSFGGLIMHPRTRMVHVAAAIPALAAHLRGQGFKTVMYRPAPHPYQRQAREEDVYFLEQAGARRIDTKLHSMVICGSDVGVRAKTWAKVIRRAREAGVRSRIGGDEDLPVYWEQVERLLAVHGQRPVHTLDEVRLLRARFPDALDLRIAEGAQGEFLAGHLTLRSGPAIAGLYLGETPQGREVHAGSMIKHHHLTAPENAGCWLDFGQWCDTDTREGSDSLLHYKESMGGRLIRRHTWQLDL